MRKYNAFTMMELSVSLIVVAILLTVMTTVAVFKNKTKINNAPLASCQWQKMSGTHMFTRNNLVISETFNGDPDALLTVDSNSDFGKDFFPTNWANTKFPWAEFNKSLTHFNNSSYRMLQNDRGSLVFHVTGNDDEKVFSAESISSSNIALLPKNSMNKSNIEKSISIGNAIANSSNSIAIGNNAAANVNNKSIAIGNGAIANSSLAIGSEANVDSAKIVLGNNPTTEENSANWGVVIKNNNIYFSPRLPGVSLAFSDGSNINSSSLSVTETANVTAVVTSSDRRVKNVKSQFKAGIDELNKITPYTFTFKNDETKKVRTGVIAQDLQKVFPNSVHESKDTKMLSISTDEMLYAMVNAVKDIYKNLVSLRESVALLAKNILIKIASIDGTLEGILADISIDVSLDELDGRISKLHLSDKN